jgi:hypothetical protein
MTSSGVPTFLVLSTLAVHEISRRRIAMLGPTGSCEVCEAPASQSCIPTNDSPAKLWTHRARGMDVGYSGCVDQSC